MGRGRCHFAALLPAHERGFGSAGTEHIQVGTLGDCRLIRIENALARHVDRCTKCANGGHTGVVQIFAKPIWLVEHDTEPGRNRDLRPIWGFS